MLDLRKWQERYRLYWMHKGALQGLAAGLLAVGLIWALWGQMFWLIVPVFTAAGAIVRWHFERSDERLIKELDRRAGLNQRLLTYWQVSQRASDGHQSENPFLKPLARSIEAILRPTLGREVFPLQWWPESVIILFLAAALTSGYWFMQEQPQVGLLVQENRTTDQESAAEDSLGDEFEELLQEETGLPDELPPSTAGLQGDASDVRQELDEEGFSAQDRAIARDRAARLVEEEIREIPRSTRTERDVQTWSADSDEAGGEGDEYWDMEQRDPYDDDENGASMIIDGLEDSGAEGDDEMDANGGGNGQSDPTHDEEPWDEEAGVGQGAGDGESPDFDPSDSDANDRSDGESDESSADGGDGVGAGDGVGSDGEPAAPFDETVEFFDAQLEGQVTEEQWLVFLLEELGEMDADLGPTQLEERLLSYRQELLNQMSQETIPLRYREWIRDYFSLITAN